MECFGHSGSIEKTGNFAISTVLNDFRPIFVHTRQPVSRVKIRKIYTFSRTVRKKYITLLSTIVQKRVGTIFRSTVCIWSHGTLRQTKNFVFGLSELYDRPKTLYLVCRNFMTDQKLCIWSVGTLRQTKNFVFGLAEFYDRPKTLYMVSSKFTAYQKLCIWSRRTSRQTKNFVFGLTELYDRPKKVISYRKSKIKNNEQYH
jgi:hypothetical protein